MSIKEQWSYVRELARKYMEIAQSKEMFVRRKRWDDMYMSRKPDRPPISISASFIEEEEPKCNDELCRRAEKWFNAYNFRINEFADDCVQYPYYPVVWQLNSDNFDWSVEFSKGFSDGNTSRNLYENPPIKAEKDLKRLKVINVMDAVYKITHVKNELQYVSALEEQLSDIIPVKRIVSYYPWPGGMAAKLMGMTELMVNMAVKPDFVHSTMKMIQQNELHILDTLEQNSVFSGESNCHQNYPNILTESLKTTPASFPCKLNELWAFVESQEFQLVSPDMTNQFLYEYQKSIMRRFKHVAYGCCENLTKKWDYITVLPHVRAVVNSPWTDLKTTVDKCGDKFAILWRQPFSEIMFAKSDDDLRRDIERGMKITQGCSRAIFCREVNWNLVPNPKQRALKWVEEAKRAAEKYA